MTEQILTRELVRDYLIYNLNTGVFTWKKNRIKRKIGCIAGAFDKNGYRIIRIFGRTYFSHRLAFMYVLGYFPEQVDHINHVRDNNKWINLRPATMLINQRNRSININNETGVTGVAWHKKSKKWRARIKVNEESIHLGLFSNIEDAITVRESANIKYGFHANHGI